MFNNDILNDFLNNCVDDFLKYFLIDVLNDLLNDFRQNLYKILWQNLELRRGHTVDAAIRQKFHSTEFPFDRKLIFKIHL